MANIYTEVALHDVDTKGGRKALMTQLWTCLNIIQDYSEGESQDHIPEDFETIHRAVMKA
jgi:hypothetical protein